MSIADLSRADARAQEPDQPVDGTPLATRVTAVACVVGVFVSTALVLTAADRTISLTDEGLYLLLVDDPEASIRSGTGFHVIFNPLFELVDLSLIHI